MDTIATIIVTAFINIIITGIVSNLIFYRYQKNIDSSLAEKLEKLRSDLQYSNFEQQTKFTRIHEKRVETLENLYQRFLIIYDKFANVVYQGIEDFREENTTNLNSDYIDFYKYLEQNRLFLSTDSIFEIQEIWVNASKLCDILPVLKIFYETVDTSPFSSRDYYQLRNELDEFGFNVKGIKSKADLAVVFDNIPVKMRDQVQKLEMIYKSVADSNLVN